MTARPVRYTLFIAALLAFPFALRAQAPAAAFFAQPSFPVAGTTVRFLDTSANNPTSWLWDFGDPSSEVPTLPYCRTRRIPFRPRATTS